MIHRLFIHPKHKLTCVIGVVLNNQSLQYRSKVPYLVPAVLEPRITDLRYLIVSTVHLLSAPLY